MVFRSTKGSRLLPRYKLSILAYSDHVFDLLWGENNRRGSKTSPSRKIQTHRLTDTAKAFSVVEKLLQKELPNLQDVQLLLFVI